MLWQRYYRPESISEALEVLSSEHGRARLVAGATDLVIQLRRGELQTDALVDVTRIRSLQFVRRNGAKIEIGALVTHAEVARSELVNERAPVLCEACFQVGSPQIRNVGTVVGNVVSAEPAGDSIIALLALDARLTIVGPGYEKQMPVVQACLAPGRSIIDPTREMVTHLEFELPLASYGSAYERLAQRHSLALPIMAVGAFVVLDLESRCFESARIGIGPVAPVPFRATAAEDLLRGAAVEIPLICEAACLAGRDAAPRDSVRGDAAYRKQMVQVLVRRALVRAVKRAGGHV